MTDPTPAVQRAQQLQAELPSLADGERVAALEGIAASLEAALADDAS